MTNPGHPFGRFFGILPHSRETTNRRIGNPASDIGGAIQLFDIASQIKNDRICHDCWRRRPGNQLRPLAFAGGVKPREG